MRTLILASKCYSSWSLRPWLLMKVLDIPFDEVVIGLRQPGTAKAIARYSPSGKLPLLKEGEVSVWDSLAIIEYLAETQRQADVWPKDPTHRALARSIAAEMHSSFQSLRNACPMNLAFRFKPRDRGPEVAADVTRITQIWTDARTRFGSKAGGGGPFLFGNFCAVDAMFAPVVTRLDTYQIAVDPVSRAYMDAVLALPAFSDWRWAALTEPAIPHYDDIGEEIAEHFRSH